MLTIRRKQLEALEGSQLAELKHRIVETLRERWPPTAGAADLSLGDFVHQAITSARAIWIDEPAQIIRYAHALMRVAEDTDPLLPGRFTPVMLTEQSAEARLLFVERHLLQVRRADAT